MVLSSAISKLPECHADILVCIKLLFTDYTNSRVLNAKFQHYSVVIKVASKVFCQCLYIPGQSDYDVINTVRKHVERDDE